MASSGARSARFTRGDHEPPRDGVELVAAGAEVRITGRSQRGVRASLEHHDPLARFGTIVRRRAIAANFSMRGNVTRDRPADA